MEIYYVINAIAQYKTNISNFSYDINCGKCFNTIKNITSHDGPAYPEKINEHNKYFLTNEAILRNINQYNEQLFCNKCNNINYKNKIQIINSKSYIYLNNGALGSYYHPKTYCGACRTLLSADHHWNYSKLYNKFQELKATSGKTKCRNCNTTLFWK